MKEILSKIRQQLQNNIDPKALDTSQNFFKEKIKCYGVRTAAVKKISKDNFQALKCKNKAGIFELCEDLWKSGYIEESFIACHWSYYIHEHYKPGDFEIFKKWIDTYVSNWASCDTLCNHTVGEFIEMYPEYVSELKQFTDSKNRWMRRASAVSLIIPARKGKFLRDVFDIADRLLVDEDDLVQKGYGWMLKAASQQHLQEVFDFVIKNKKIMPRTALRYAIEKMPKDLKSVAMGK
jgi:3-methyladenine DNA glycosylase AlkD